MMLYVCVCVLILYDSASKLTASHLVQYKPLLKRLGFIFMMMAERLENTSNYR